MTIDLSVLTRAERDVVRLALAGLPVRQISEQLVVSESTVHTHLTNIYRKLGVTGRVDLLARAAALQETAERPVEVTSPPARRPLGLEASIAIATGGVLVALIQPVTAFPLAFALLAVAAVAAWRRSLGVGDRRVPLLLGGLVCVLLGLASLVLPRPV
jgi:DNA-binding CsgD family transcriptional regulator